MNSECRPNSVHATSSYQQGTLRPSKYAAAGDAPRGRILPNPNLITRREIFVMNASLSTTPKNDDSRAKSRFIGSCTHPQLDKIFKLPNDTSETKDSSSLRVISSPTFVKNDDNKSRSASMPCTIRTTLGSHSSPERELPSREFSHETTLSCNHKNLATNERTESEIAITASMAGVDLSITNETYDVENMVSPSRKISMFSAEIWTEKVLPIDTFVCPEPELVEIYFDHTNKITNELNDFGNYSTESMDLSPARMTSNYGVSGRNIPTSPPLSARKDESSLSGQKAINFNDEIWPVCPKLIPSGKELPICIMESRYETISPEKLNENEEELIVNTRIPHSPCKSANIFEVTSNINSRSEKTIKPTHEIERQKDFVVELDSNKFFNNINSRSTISETSIAALKISQKFDRVSHEPSSVTNILDETQNNNFRDEFSRQEPSCERRSEERLREDGRCKQEMKNSFQRLQMKTLEENPLFTGSSGPINTVYENIRDPKAIDSANERESHAPGEKLDKIGVEQTREYCTSTTTVQQVSLARVKTSGDGWNEIIGEVSRETIKLPQSPAFEHRNNMPDMGADLGSSSQGVCTEIHVPENDTRSLGSTRNIQENSEKKNRKCTKAVRFNTSDTQSKSGSNKTATRQTKDLQIPDTKLGQSKLDIALGKVGAIADHIQRARQIEVDAELYSAVNNLAKVELIVKENHQTVERLQQLQPNVTFSRLTSPDAEKSLATALMRCRNYVQHNGYNRKAADTINRLLTTAVHNLKQSVEKQRLILKTQERRIAARGHRRQSKRWLQEICVDAGEMSSTVDFETSQIECSILDILILTEEIASKSNGKEFQETSTFDRTNNSTENTRAPAVMTYVRANDIGSFKESQIDLKAGASKVTRRSVVPDPNKDKEAVKNGSEKTMLISGASTKPRIGSDQQKVHLKEREKSHPELEDTRTPISLSTESTKTLKKLINELWEKRPTSSPRHLNVPDAPNNVRSLANSHHTTTNEKLPVWKPGGNNFVQPSQSVIQDNQKTRQPSSASVNKKKITANEHTRDARPHHRTRAKPEVIKKPSKIPEKPMINTHNTMSLAKIRTVPARRHQSEMVYFDRNKVQITDKFDGTRARKPRSKSRTRTRRSNKVLRPTVTEIPLEHAEHFSQIMDQKALFTEGLALSRKTSSSPKDIIQMLKELIKASGNETKIPNASPVQIVGQCNVDKKFLYEAVDHSAPLEMEVKLMSEPRLANPGRKGARETEDTSENVETATHVTNNRGILADEEMISREDTLTLAVSAGDTCIVSTSNSKASSNPFIQEDNTPSVSDVGRTAEFSSGHSIKSARSKFCQASLTSSTSHAISEDFISSQISDTEVTSGRVESQQDSNESFDAMEDLEVTRDICLQPFQEESTSTLRKQFPNKHARSLEMLKKILSDQGLGIHFLSRAENELKNRCKCSSNKGGLVTRKSMQDTALTTPNVSVGLINGIPDNNFSTTLFGDLATLSESENDVNHVEAATMTSGEILDVSTNDRSTSDRFDSLRNNEDKAAFVNKITMVENATQFDITSKSDMCVGDGIICDVYIPHVTKNQGIPEDNVIPLYRSPATVRSLPPDPVVNGNGVIECNLPNKIIDAFRLAATRATNLYTAVDILRGSVPSEIITQSNSALNPISAEILVRPLSAVRENSLDNGSVGSDHSRDRNETFGTHISEMKFMETSEKLKIIPTVRITEKRIQTKINNDSNCNELITSTEESLKRKVSNRNTSTENESHRPTTGNDSQNDYNLNKINLIEPVVRPKPFLMGKQTVSTIVDSQIVDGEQISTQNQVLTLENESSCLAKQIQTLHFAGRRNASTDSNPTKTGLNVIEPSTNSVSANLVDYESPKVVGKVQDSLAGSPIKNLLEKNLQRFKTNYSSIFDEKHFTDFRDELLIESSDDQGLNNETITETATSAVDDRKMFTRMNNMMNCLLNEVAENDESSITTKGTNLNIHLPQRRHLRKPVRRLKSEKPKRTDKRSLLCENHWDNLSGMIVFRKHLLSLIYAVICSFVFCCLQLSVYCEV